QYAKSAAIEALNNGLNIVIITEGMPVHDTLEVIALAQKKRRIVIGPNSPGMLIPNEMKIGIIPSKIAMRNLVGENVGVVSRSGTLTYEIVSQLTAAGVGQSAIVGIGGDPVVGTDFIEILEMFENDSLTDKIVLIGEIGGDAEERAATYIKNNISKEVVAYVAGRTAPKERRMGHAGAIISGDSGTATSKIEALEKAGVKVAETPSQIVELLKIKKELNSAKSLNR
ncbi:MAG: succinate--CoA ligase subunit alpha, partial [Nanoarchaeota archaeon]|nr:succinate--CoA ligase subunit alpha [Nanoarchaeota archaeon]